MDNLSFLNTGDASFIENLYNQYIINPESIDSTWLAFFKGFDFARKNYNRKLSTEIVTENKTFVDKEFMVLNLIEGYRTRGHLFTKTNPVRIRRKYFPTLEYRNFGLSDNDLSQTFRAGVKIGIGEASLQDIINHLNTTYCKSIGVEYMFIRQPEILDWLQKRMEKNQNKGTFGTEQKLKLYHCLVKAVGFESFIHKRFVGQKRFSLEGAEGLIPALRAIINKGAEMGLQEFIIGMPHRGRLNVLANILEKPYENIFSEFIGKKYDETIALGDVKYHLGFGNDILTENGKSVRLNLVPNPSHLETVGAVVQGICRSKIEHKYDNSFEKIAPIIIHGDAAIAGQGIVYEIIQMSQLSGYKTGGTIHLVINNQVGFTTNYTDARSSIYCTDIAKVTQSPIFHVNGDDVEALAYTIQLAMEFRQKFNIDIFIDILCYRKYGHNEGDEPRFTQPILYKAISNHPNPRELYARKLIEEQTFSLDLLEKLQSEFDQLLDSKYELSKSFEKVIIKQFLEEDWKKYQYPNHDDFFINFDTKFNKEQLISLAKKINSLPADKKFYRKVEKILEDRNNHINNNLADWATAELLAYATLLVENHSVRISGQDSERGTFSHRHAVYVIEDSDEKYFPLKNLSEKQAEFSIYNSPLNEYGVLGFEYGYALSNPDGLTIWEAQFGDFHNMAQAVIDQYICTAEEKWGLMNGLVLLLPHGFEGQGPEHSSGRIERFLQLAAMENIQILNCTSPANFFHAIRRQLKRNFRVPLIIFTPKSLLRSSLCVSTLDELADGNFQEIIEDFDVDYENVTRVVFCSGKIYFDLLEIKNKLKVKDIALIRIEQIYPLPEKQITQVLKKFPNNMLTLWVQEEPENMGAWHFIRNHLKMFEIEPVTRQASASPAVGLNFLHILGQQEILNKVFRKCTCDLKNIYCGLQCVTGKSREEILKQHRYLIS